MEDENSSSDSEGVVDETDDSQLERNKRSVGGWCGTNDTSPPPTAYYESSPSTAAFYENPKFGQQMQLFSKSGYFLAAYPDGTVRGTQDSNDLHTFLEISNAGEVGHVRIMGLLSRVYVAMNKRGRLYAENNMWMEGTIFIEALEGVYNTYLSRANAHKGWYLGIKKSGKTKNGRKTGHRQKAVMFLPLRKRFQ